jgi:hypothetical protein
MLKVCISYLWGSLTWRKSYDMEPTASLPLRTKSCYGYLSFSTGFEPANLGFSGMHATTRSSKGRRVWLRVSPFFVWVWQQFSFIMGITQKMWSSCSCFRTRSGRRPVVNTVMNVLGGEFFYPSEPPSATQYDCAHGIRHSTNLKIVHLLYE